MFKIFFIINTKSSIPHFKAYIDKSNIFFICPRLRVKNYFSTIIFLSRYKIEHPPYLDYDLKLPKDAFLYKMGNSSM